MQFGEQVNDYIAAGGHNGNQSRQLVRHLAEDLGFQYLAAEGKEKFDDVVIQFLNSNCEQPILLECFTTPQDESDAQYILDHLIASVVPKSKQTNLIETAKAMVPQRVKRALKELLRHG